MRQVLSACVIAKDEAENIRRWLACMQAVADEMIVVDTGSTDETREIACAAGARVYDFPWQGDFAAAKNFALSKARGHWVLFLDADEFFTEESRPRVRARLEALAPDPRVLGVLCPLVNIDADHGNRRMTSLLQVRLFRHVPRLRYEGRVHETLTLPEGRGLVLAPELTILHTGYSASVVRGKLRRNLALLQQRIAMQGPEPMDDRYFMDIYYGLGMYAEATRHANKLIAHSETSDVLRARAYETWVSCLMADQKAAKEVVACFEAARAACPQFAEFPLMQGLYAFERRDWLAAERLLTEGMALHASYRQDSADAVMDNAARLLPDVCWRLGCLRQLAGHLEEAAAFFREGLRRFHYHGALLRAFFDSLRQLGTDDAGIIAALETLYGQEDASFVAEALARHAGGGVYLFYARRAGRHGTPGLDFLAAGRSDAAAALAASRLEGIHQLVRRAMAQGAPAAAALQPLLPEERERRTNG